MNNMVVKSPCCAILHNRTSSFSRSDRLVGFHLFITHLHQKTICSARETFHPSTSIQRIFCMGHCLHISQINDQTIGSVWTAFQLNASTGARLAGSADEKSLGEKSCKVTDQRGPHPWSGFSPQMNEEWTFLQMNVKLISPKYK